MSAQLYSGHECIYPVNLAQRYTFRVSATDSVSNVGLGEVSTLTPNAVIKYYYLGGQRVAVRKPDGEVNWLHGDHLGSTSLATDRNGGEVSRQLFYPFGEVRWASAKLPTDFGFTGQWNASTIGLYDYHARFYDLYPHPSSSGKILAYLTLLRGSAIISATVSRHLA